MKSEIILGVRIDDLSIDDTVLLIKSWLEDNKKRQIFTPNPEFLMAAQTDSEFRAILNSSDLNIPDGIGLKLSGQIQNTTPGVDLMEKLCQLAEAEGAIVGFLGGRNGSSKRAAECLRKRYPKLKVSIALSGPEVNMSGEEDTKYQILNTDILFVGFGQVKQEKWIKKNIDKLPVKIMMGVGGSFDYLSGDVPRAPNWMRSLGLEWLFRLIIQPWRIKRQLALFKFIWLILKD